MADGSSFVASPNDGHVRHSMPFSRGRPPHQVQNIGGYDMQAQTAFVANLFHLAA